MSIFWNFFHFHRTTSTTSIIESFFLFRWFDRRRIAWLHARLELEIRAKKGVFTDRKSRVSGIIGEVVANLKYHNNPYQFCTFHGALGTFVPSYKICIILRCVLCVASLMRCLNRSSFLYGLFLTRCNKSVANRHVKSCQTRRLRKSLLSLFTVNRFVEFLRRVFVIDSWRHFAVTCNSSSKFRTYFNLSIERDE